MNWIDSRNGLIFSTVEERNFVIDAFVDGGIYPELSPALAKQKELRTPFLVLPQHRLREIEGYLSSFEKSFDEALKKKDYARTDSEMTPKRRKEIIEGVQEFAESQLRQQHEPELVNAWLAKLSKLQADVTNYVAGGADKETVQRLIWGEIRSLVFTAGADYYSTRTARYLAENRMKKKPSALQKIIWWFRAKALDWKYSRQRVLYGPNERFVTELGHDPSKITVLRCGYCGEEFLDDSVRPKFVRGFPSARIDVEKADGDKSLLAHTSLMQYAKPFHCPKCDSELHLAYISRLARAVVAILV